MDKIIEEVITRIIERIEKIEEKIKNWVPTQNTKLGTKPGMASQGQLNFIKGLGGIPNPNMTSGEASDYINKLKEMKEKQNKTNNIIKAEGQMAQEMVEKYGDKDIFEEPKSIPLTQEEIGEIGEENLL